MPYHLYSSVLIYLIPIASISAVGPSCLLQPVLRLQQSVPNIPVSFCYIKLIQPWQSNRLFQSDTVSSKQSVGDNSLIQLWYHTCIRPEGVTGLWRFCVCTYIYQSIYTYTRKNATDLLYLALHLVPNACKKALGTRSIGVARASFFKGTGGLNSK